jgi:leucyl/phenylalanyl-tRNA--protein transferase
MRLPYLSTQDPFPSPRKYSDIDPEVPGLIAISETINAEQLYRAYREGIFPWYSDGQPILWWSPNPRMVLNPKNFKISKSFRKILKDVLIDSNWEVRIDYDFHETILSCATQKRKNQHGTWITNSIMQAYRTLHENKHAHSIETFYKGQRVGGLYCVNLGQMIYGESMFSDKDNASKIALATLSAWCIAQDIQMIDCQQETKHLTSLGGEPISRNEFLDHLDQKCDARIPNWEFNKGVLASWLKKSDEPT